jgi:hypothetical protein
LKSPLRYAPLSSGFMLISMIGFLVSALMISGWSESWGFTFSLIFTMMFIASMVSMTKAEPITEHMESLAIHKPKIIHKKRDTTPHFNGIHWYEPLLIIYFAFWLFFVYQSFIGKVDQVNSWISVIFLLVTIGLMIFFIEDAISNERLRQWQQLVFTVLLVFTAGMGIFIYYIYKRMKS